MKMHRNTLAMAAELAPQNSAIVNNYGIANLLAGDPVLAEEAFRDAISRSKRAIPPIATTSELRWGGSARYAEAMRAFRSRGQ